MWCFQPERRRSLVLFAWYLTYPAECRRVEIFLGIALDYSFWMRSITRRRANYSARGGGVAEGTSRGENAKKNDTSVTRVENAGKKNHELFLFFSFFFFIQVCAAIKNMFSRGLFFKPVFWLSNRALHSERWSPWFDPPFRAFFFHLFSCVPQVGFIDSIRWHFFSF